MVEVLPYNVLSMYTVTKWMMCAGAETRCYCNEAACVSTGYMCKSATLGVCYSRLTSDGATVRSTHGCAESLPEVEYGACSRLVSTSSGNAGEMSLLLCCHRDMCNYRSDDDTDVAPPGECLKTMWNLEIVNRIQTNVTYRYFKGGR